MAPTHSTLSLSYPPHPLPSSHYVFSYISSHILLSASKNRHLESYIDLLHLLYKFRTSNAISTVFHQMLPYPNPQYLAESHFIGDGDQDNPPSIPNDCYPSFFSFPLSPPNFDHDLLLTTHLTTTNNLEAPTLLTLDTAVDMDMTTNVPPMTRSSSRRKRPFRTDRHSKIFTAQGLRDRRMRLSQEVASKFFNLQDLLGFDKASQTVDWLLTQSKSAIQQLIDVSQLENQSINLSSFASESSASECFSAISNDKQKSAAASLKAKDISLQPLGIATLDPTLTKEMRDQARARAKERTREKKRIRSGRYEDSCKQDQPSSKTDAMKEGAICINGVYQVSPMTMVPSSLMSNNNNTICLLDKQMNINFPSNIKESLLLANVQFQSKSVEAYNTPTS